MAPRPDTRRDLGLAPYKIAAVFILLGVLWVMFSDALLDKLALNTASLERLQTINGVFFVLFASAVVLVLARAYARRLGRAIGALQESERKYRTLFNSSPESISIISAQGLVLDLNHAAQDLMGVSRDHMVGKKLADLDLLHPDDLEKLLQAIRSLAPGRATSPVEIMVRTDGRELLVENHLSLLRKSDGGSDILLVSRDVSEQRKALEALRRSEERFRTAAGMSHDFIFEWDSETGRFEWFGDVDAFFGYEVGSFPRNPFKVNSLIHAEDRPRVMEALARHLRQGDPFREEFRVRRGDGSYILVSSRGTVIHDPSSKVRWVGVSTDITARKNYDAKLKRAAREWRRTFDAIPDLILLIDPEQRIVRVNRAVTSCFGLSFPEVLGLRYSPLVYGLVEPPATCPLLLTLGDGMEHSGEARIEALGRDYQLQSTPLFDDDGSLTSSVLLLHDITEHKLLEAELQKAERIESLGLLAGGIAHDFNNILTVIAANISLTRRQIPSGHKTGEMLAEAEHAVFRAKGLTRQLLTFSRGGAPVRKAMDLPAMIMETARFALRGSRSRCVFDLAEGLWPAEVDEGQISQVINNLVINADQAMPEGGTITVEGNNIEAGTDSGLPLAPGRYVRIAVRDQGPGIPPEVLPRIFDPYFTTKQDGSGLGLAISYSVVRRHGGHIGVEPAAEKGGVFQVLLPATDQVPETPPEEPERLAAGHGRVLVMDDDDHVRRVAARVLKSAGFQVEVAADGREALAKYREAMKAGRPFAAVIMDLTVSGGMGGTEAMARLLQIDPDARAVVSSGYSQDPVMADHQKYGFKGVVTKPFRTDDLVEAVIRAMGL